MKFLEQFEKWRRQSHLTQVASDTAACCQQQVWDLVGVRVATMRAAEVRGYVRARSAGIVQAAAKDAAARENLSASLQTTLAELISGNLTSYVNSQLSLQPAAVRRAA